MLVSCLNCEKEFNKHPSQIKKTKNNFCSRSCAAKINNKLKPKKIKKRHKCVFCKTNETSRKYCTVECSIEHHKELKIKKWLDGHDKGWTGTAGMLRPFIRNYLLQQANYKCSKCKWDKLHPVTNTSTLHIHHTDGNYKNCRPDNLEVLCPNCHSLTENYGFRNKKPGRNRNCKLVLI